MAVLQSTNVQGTLCVNGVAVGGGKDFKYCCFTASTTWTPSQDLVDGNGHIDALVVAGGGGGGYAALRWYSQNPCNAGLSVCGAGGGGGSVVTDIVKIDATDACTVTVGAGGDGAYNTSWDWPEVDSGDGSQGGASAFSDIQIGGGGIGRSWCAFCCFIAPSQGDCGAKTSRTINGGTNIGDPGGSAGVKRYQGYLGTSEDGSTSLGAQHNACNFSNCYSQSVADGNPTCWRTYCSVCSRSPSNVYFNALCKTNAHGPWGVVYDGKSYGGGSYGDPCNYGFLDSVAPNETGSLECDDDGFSLNRYAFASGANYLPICQNNYPPGCCLCLFCSVYTGSSVFPEEKGKGGLAGKVNLSARYSAPSYGRFRSCVIMAGTKGSDGVVILKWME